ncbi:hypothetical protein Acr_19g0011290 [Actinidia rufa]|uniref:Uncharacterized protein n=1 Tax=Actinidia rufa TaxID=165716 RepID=A0A7J0GBS2_9ERIC|nr:hypothetical protein Acr_19g0011290 [Actinidia rufa]
MSCSTAMTAARAVESWKSSFCSVLFLCGAFGKHSGFELLKKREQRAYDLQPKQCQDFVKRLDEGLFRNASTKEEYLCLETLERRLQVLIRRSAMSNHSQQYPQPVSSSSPIATMIPTPGMPLSGSSSRMGTSSVDAPVVAASGGNSILPATGFLSTSNGSSVGINGGCFNSSEGPMPNVYQKSLSNFSISSASNNMASSTGVQRMTSHMIPTPGFNSNNNQSFMNLEPSNGTGAFSTVGSTIVSQPLTQNQHFGGQNSRILHNLGSHLGSGKQKSYGFPNGALNGGLGIIRNNVQLINGPAASDGYLTATSYGNSPKPINLEEEEF